MTENMQASRTQSRKAVIARCCLKSYVGERVIIRLLMPADKPRNISFILHGHNWRAQPNDPLSSKIPVQGAVSV